MKRYFLVLAMSLLLLLSSCSAFIKSNVESLEIGKDTISADANHTAAVKKDGTVMVVGESPYYGADDVTSWTNIVAVDAGDEHTIGLKADGTVVAVGSNEWGQCDVSSWSNIVSICAGQFHTIGLKVDGTLVATGKNDAGQCDVSGVRLW